MPKRSSPDSSKGGARSPKEAKNYHHAEEHPQRPDMGTEKQFKKRKPPTEYRYDSSLAPEMQWDENPVREEAEALIAQILAAGTLEEAQVLAMRLKRLGQPFLNWTGKAERAGFEVPTLPLFVHERLSTRAIIETLRGHRAGSDQLELSLFGDPQWSIADQILKAYEYHDRWVNRLILGDSLVVMNSLIQYEGMAGKVQMIYIDPPYGVKFGSNFQPFVRKRDVKHNDDAAFTREPEMVQAYRDTWELGLHSYLTYLRDRLTLARELLADSGSVFVQISDENVHHVREIMDEVFGVDNFCEQIFFQKTSYATSELIPSVGDYLVWYAKERANIKIRKLFFSSLPNGDELSKFYVDLDDGSSRKVTREEVDNPSLLEDRSKLFQSRDLASAGAGSSTFDFIFQGKKYHPGANRHWKTNVEGLNKLVEANRIFSTTNSLRYKRYINDYPWTEYINVWTDTIVGSFHEEKLYVVQTSPKVIERCILMTTDPGDLVMDLTCGSGTTAYVAEQWGRRWITCDVSRVPLALARQRLLTATFPWYKLNDQNSPASGFIYQRKQNKKGEEIGGLVPHITLKSIANDEPPAEEVLVDRPEIDKNIVRVSSPFTIECTIKPPIEITNDNPPETSPTQTSEPIAIVLDSSGDHAERMLRILQQSPILRLPGNRTIHLSQVRQPTRSQTLNAEALVKASELDGSNLSEIVEEAIETNQNKLPLSQKNIAFIFGSENGAISENAIFQAAQEAHAKHYAHLFVIGFAITASARQFIEQCDAAIGIPATYIQATPDLLMGDLLKNMRSSQIFSVCGLPEIQIHKLNDGQYQVELQGLDVFDPVSMEVESEPGHNVPAWFLDTNYNDLCFYVHQAFFPRTSAWDSLKKSLKGTYDDDVWEHLAGTKSKAFEPGDRRKIAVKVIDDRGNELLVVKDL
jgi:adenine-specific DNA-methyltransferase